MLLTFWQISVVPFWGILVSKINGLPFSGGATGDGSGEACPFFGHPCLQNKWFAVFRGCNRRRHVPFLGILVSKINGLPFSGGATGDGSGAACPKMSKPFIFETRMFIFGT